ncbi:VaFE repeat-containing surface-anchored protein [Erysipelothrix sp. HDW6A]|uniref:SpaA isopeptide-forming pilin-related protein n=1 Tax=Erysipelothrix sp. HDW6A TaxID=2714928 RepID=UPI00140E3546|nr:SpaA isopeptide-forming pilin-related protein [Erysipelothrix sp. HDW6A]QIK56359.1 VaFE repeat-containing surface-anchored protein [Erysipelothrix sp. HDW6A]
MRKHRFKIRALKRAIMSFTLFCLSMLMVLTYMTTGVSANDDEVYFNDDMSVVIKVDRKLDKDGLKLDLLVNTEKNITVEDIQVLGESIKNDDFLYSYAVGENGSYKFSVITTRIEEIIKDNEEVEIIERQETFIFTLKVDEIVDVQEENETQAQVEEKTETDLEAELLDPSELVEETKDTNVDALPEDNQNTGTEVIEEKEVIPDGTVVRQLDKLPSMSEINSVLADDEYILYDQETGRIDVIKDSQRTQNITRQKRATTSAVTKGKILSQGISFYWKANPSFAWNLPGGMSEFFVNAIDAYCIEPGVLDVETYNAVATDLASVGEIRVMDGRLYTTLTQDQQKRMELIANYGYRYEGHQTDAYRWATQVLIFETVGWGFNSYGTLNITNEIAEIERLVASHRSKPNWDGTEKEVKIGDIVDLSNPLNTDFIISSHEGLDILEDSGTTLRVKVIDKNATLIMDKKQGSSKGTSYIYTDGHSQRVGNFALGDPVFTIIDFKVVSHSQRFLKLGENGEPLAGVKFRASYNNTLDSNGLLVDGWDYVTGSDGYTAYDTWNNDGAVVYVQEIQAIAPYVNNKEIKTFTVTAGSETTLSFTNAKAVGTASIAKTEKGTTTPIAGVVYDYVHSSGQVVDTVTTNAYGIATTGKHPLGSYSFVEKSVPAPYILDATPIPANLVYKDQHTAVVSVSVKQENSKAVGNASITKTEKGTNTPIAGVVYDYVHSSGRVVETLTTNAQGIAKTKNHDLGNYSFVEKFVPAPYILDATPIPANLVYKDQHTAVVSASVKQENSRAVGRIEGMKVSNHGDPLQGVKLNVLNASNTIVASLVTGADGKFSTGELPLGTYTIVETATINGFVLDKTPHTVTLAYKDQVTPIVLVSKEIPNKHQRSDVVISKTEDNWDTIFPEYNGITLSGATIELFAKTDIYEGSKRIYRSGELIGREITNSVGQVIYHNLPIGEFYAKESKAPQGYQPFNGQWDISIKYDGNNPTVEVTRTSKTVTNQVDYGRTRLIKSGNNGLVLLENAHFGLYREKDDKLIFDGYTDKNGQLESPDIRTNERLYWQEIKAPSGYITSDRKYPVTITEHGETAWVIAVNEMAKVKLRIFKPNSETQEPLADAHFRILNTDTNEWVVIKTQQGNNVVEVSEWVTDETGYFTMEEYLLAGNYRLIETIAPEGFNIADPIDFVVDENTKVVELEVIGKVLDMTVENRPIRSDIAVAKVSKETGEHLPNFPMLLTSLSDMSTVELLTNEEGIALFEQYLFGAYMVEEIGVDGEYLIDRTPQFINITEDGIVYEVTFENSKPTGTVEYTKTDEDTGDAVSGAVYRVWNDEGTFEQEIETDENGKWILTGLPLSDNYHYQELQAPYGYIIDETVYDFEIKYIDMDTAVITKDFEGTNKHFIGEFKGLKLDEDTKEALQGAIYEFTLPDGSTVHVESDENGEFGLSELEEGHYTYTEIKQPSGYTIDRTVYEFDIEYEDQYTPVVTVSHERVNKANRTVIMKVDTDGNPRLAQLELYKVLEDGSREFVLSLQTDAETGKAVLDKLTDGNYRVVETWVEAPYFVDKSQNEKELIITADQNEYSVTFVNDTVKGRLVGLKQDYKEGFGVAGAEYGLFTLEDELVQSTLTDKDGRFVFEGFDLGEYYLQEIATVEGYRLDDNKYPVSFEYVDAHTPVIIRELNVKEMRVPEIGTTASFGERDKQEPNIVTLVDKVRYLNLVIGKEYTVNGLLMNPTTGLPILIDGKEVTATTTFIAEKHDGFVEVFFTFDASKLETKKVVVFEDLLEEDTPIAFHHDLTDIHQTVEIPEIGTSLSFTERDKQEPNIVTLTDVVSYNGLVVGKEYTVTGVLMDFHTEKPILIDGKEITASTSFIAESTSGTVNVEFVFDQNKLTTDRVVAFEKVEEGERLIAVHADINDLEQTIDILTYRILKKDSGTKEVLKDAEFTRWDIDGNVIEVKSTDETGVVEFKLFYGEINTAKETDAPLGYLLSERIVTMDTTEHEDGTLFEVEYLNTPKPAGMLPPTGVDNSSFLFALPMILLGMVLLIAAIIKKRQARSEMTGFSTVSLNKGSKFYEQFVNDESHEGNKYVHGTTTPGTNKHTNQNSSSHSSEKDDSHGNKLE